MSSGETVIAKNESGGAEVMAAVFELERSRMGLAIKIAPPRDKDAASEAQTRALVSVETFICASRS